MGTRLVNRREAANVINMAALSVAMTAQRAEPSEELRVWLQGYGVALAVVAQGLGVEELATPIADNWPEVTLSGPTGWTVVTSAVDSCRGL